MAVLIGKTSIAIASRVQAGIVIGKTSMAVASRVSGAWAAISKTSLMVASQEPIEAGRRRMSLM